MAHLRKRKSCYQLQYYLDGKLRQKWFSPIIPKSVVLAEKKRIEAALALHKAGIRPFTENDYRFDNITLR